MRTAIILVGVLIASAILRGFEAAYGVKVAPNQAADFEAWVIAACIIMDIVEFVRGLTSRALDGAVCTCKIMSSVIGENHAEDCALHYPPHQ